MKKEEVRKLIPIDRFVTVGHNGAEKAVIEIGESFLIDVVRTIRESDSATNQILSAIDQSDGILLLFRSKTPTGYGSLWIKHAKASGKPMTIADPTCYSQLDHIAKWITSNQLRSIAIGGPKEVKYHSIFTQSSYFLGAVLNNLIGKRVLLPSGVAGKIENSLMSNMGGKS